MTTTGDIEFICLGSGSSGNAYVLKKGDSCVLVECGFESKKLIAKLLEFGISLNSLDAVIITHKHGDHAKSLKYLIDNLIPAYAPKTALNDGDLLNSNVHIIEDGSKFKVTEWLSVYCFSVVHDVEAYGFAFLDTQSKQSILFINDTKCFDFKLNDYLFDYVFIECNHIRKQLEVVMNTALLNGKEGEVFKYKRQASFHMSLYACKKFLRRMNLSKTKAIFLMHLSRELCNDMVIKNEISSVFGIKTYVCYAEGGIN